MKIITDFVHPPIPVRQFDWCAYDSDTYDGAPDAGPQIVGWGLTKESAIEDYLNSLFDDRCLSKAEQKEQGLRCSCGGTDEYCGCQNIPNSTTLAAWRSTLSQARGG